VKRVLLKNVGVGNCFCLSKGEPTIMLTDRPPIDKTFGDKLTCVIIKGPKKGNVIFFYDDDEVWVSS